MRLDAVGFHCGVECFYKARFASSPPRDRSRLSEYHTIRLCETLDVCCSLESSCESEIKLVKSELPSEMSTEQNEAILSELHIRVTST